MSDEEINKEVFGPAASPGPGKYGDECEDVLKRLGAKCVVLIVLDGKDGSGMSVSAPYWEIGGTREFIRMLPDVLRAIARNIDGRKS